ncbi:MAG: hypothetical protein Q7T74_01680 [Candidatus Saccharibacteria bacterium]|nr:hypothetical protein [Candidatus Saccharibacteria bacterium]
MKRVGALIFCCGLFFILASQGIAQTLFPQFSQSKGTNVNATVGTTTLSISGYQSPYASIIIKTQSGTFITSTTADENGYFSVSNVLINGTNLIYCFQAADFKRVGISESCITIPGPITGDVTYTDVFLPPTIGLSKKQINAGQDAVIYGYSMPGATVYIVIEGKVITVTADQDGYYTYIYRNVPAGVFSISATASLEDKSSLTPTNDVVLEALSITQQITDTGEKVIEKVEKKVPFNILPFLLLALALLVAIGILLYKLKFRLWVIFIDFMRRRKKMHHDWFLDKWS